MLRRVLCPRRPVARGARLARACISVPGVTIVESPGEAKEVCRLLLAHGRQASQAGGVHAIDTETHGIDPKTCSPWVKGELLCFSVYGGPAADFGDGPSVWVNASKEGVVGEFLEYFRAPGVHKVYHKYSFDRAVLTRSLEAAVRTAEAVAPTGGRPRADVLQGFYADTLHMARLLSNGQCVRFGLQELSEYYDLTDRKVSMKDVFSHQLRGKGVDLHEVTKDLQASHPAEWVRYSVQDARVTWELFTYLRHHLQSFPGSDLTAGRTLWDLYEEWYRPFGAMLTDMEEIGIRVDPTTLSEQVLLAEQRILEREEMFREWVLDVCDPCVGAVGRRRGGIYTKIHGEGQAELDRACRMNLNSGLQKRQLLFAPIGQAKRASPGLPESLPDHRTFLSTVRDEEEDAASLTVARALLQQLEADLPASKKADTEAQEKTRRQAARLKRHIEALQTPEAPLPVTLRGLRIPPPSAYRTPGGWPSVSNDELLKLAGNPEAAEPNLGTLSKWSALRTHREQEAACRAMYALVDRNSIKKALSSYLHPLLAKGATGRIHADLNINTRTGRLSCKRPNFQGLPAGKKDVHRVRAALRGEEDHCILSADYNQLELRVLAHLTECRSLIAAFQSGADIHSETALDMYPDILKAFEGDRAAAAAVLKEKYPQERSRAKQLNFSIVYGTSAKSLAEDWKTPLETAYEVIDRWFAARPEVRRWQAATMETARRTGQVRTLLGRVRHVPDMADPTVSPATRSGAQRITINTPVQGSASDIVTAAMLGLHRHKGLQQIGYRVIMQMHDEVLMEGPEEWADEAAEVMRRIMEHPPGFSPLAVPLVVEPKRWNT